jgi:hypothetical protein
MKDWEKAKEIMRRLRKGEPILNKEELQPLKDEATPSGFLNTLKKDWIWLLVCLLAFFIGLKWGEYFSLTRCNEFIYEHYVIPVTEKAIQNATNIFQNIR